jgi:hypothetical protein
MVKDHETDLFDPSRGNPPRLTPRARVVINYLTSPTPVAGWGASSGLTGSACCSNDEQDLGMTHVSIPRTTNGTHEKKKRDGVVDHPFFLFFFFFFFFFFPLRLPRLWPAFPFNYKGEAGCPMQKNIRQVAETYTHNSRRLESSSLSRPSVYPYYKLSASNTSSIRDWTYGTKLTPK